MQISSFHSESKSRHTYLSTFPLTFSVATSMNLVVLEVPTMSPNWITNFPFIPCSPTGSNAQKTGVSAPLSGVVLVSCSGGTLVASVKAVFTQPGQQLLMTISFL